MNNIDDGKKAIFDILETFHKSPEKTYKSWLLTFVELILSDGRGLEEIEKPLKEIINASIIIVKNPDELTLLISQEALKFADICANYVDKVAYFISQNAL